MYQPTIALVIGDDNPIVDPVGNPLPIVYLHQLMRQVQNNIDYFSIEANHDAFVAQKRQTDAEFAERMSSHKRGREQTMFVYVMLNERNGFHKIGRSSDPAFRERTLQSQEPDVKTIAVYKGSAKDEKELHNFFAAKRIRGEWFDLTAVDLQFIEESLERASA